MSLAKAVHANLERSSWIRRMFEEGLKLKQKLGADKVYDFSLGNPDVEPPRAFKDALMAAARDERKGLHGYMPNAGFPYVREAIAAKVAREHAVAMTMDRVIMTVGAAGGLNVALKAILNPGDEVLVTKPYFAEYWFYAENHGGLLRAVDGSPGFGLDPQAIRSALSPKTAAVIVNSPNNPTGAIYSRESLVALAAVLREHGKACGRLPYLLIDEPYRDIVYDGSPVPPVLDCYEESILVSSYSKSLSLPGERIGYIAVNPAAADAGLLVEGMVMCNRVLGFVNAPALMQRAVAGIAMVTADIGSYARRRTMLMEALRVAGIEFVEPRGAFYIFCKAPARTDASAVDEIPFVMHLKESGILGVPGSGFGYPGWFRLCYCVAESTIRASAPVFKSAMDAWRKAY